MRNRRPNVTISCLGCAGIIALATIPFMGGCEKSRVIDNKVVPCAGVINKPDTAYQYELSVRNTVFAGVFAGTLFVPAITVANEIECPVRKK